MTYQYDYNLSVQIKSALTRIEAIVRLFAIYLEHAVLSCHVASVYWAGHSIALAAGSA